MKHLKNSLDLKLFKIYFFGFFVKIKLIHFGLLFMSFIFNLLLEQTSFDLWSSNIDKNKCK